MDRRCHWHVPLKTTDYSRKFGLTGRWVADLKTDEAIVMRCPISFEFSTSRGCFCVCFKWSEKPTYGRFGNSGLGLSVFNFISSSYIIMGPDLSHIATSPSWRKSGCWEFPTPGDMDFRRWKDFYKSVLTQALIACYGTNGIMLRWGGRVNLGLEQGAGVTNVHTD